MTEFCELTDAGLISFSGEDAVAFLHAQLTSDVAGLVPPGTQYSGYCSPKGRLLATFLLWRLQDEIVLQLPGALQADIQKRISRYVLRARVNVADATQRYALFGLAGDAMIDALEAAHVRAPAALHRVECSEAIHVTFLPRHRYLLLTARRSVDTVRAAFSGSATQEAPSRWSALDIEAGIPVITAAAQEQYVPQMVNLDLVGGVSYTKGCYPGQEIVARTHYLGRLKQRMYRVRVRGVESLETGQPLYSAEFGPAQASGAILNAVAAGAGAIDALAVIRQSSADSRSLHLDGLDGPPLEILALPYTFRA